MTLTALLQPSATTLKLRVTTYNGNMPTAAAYADVIDGAQLRIAGAVVAVAVRTVAVHDGVELQLGFTVSEGQLACAAVAVEATMSTWSYDHFLLIPAAVYNGNRYPRSPKIRGSQLENVDLTRHDFISVTHVPRLLPKDEPAGATEPTPWKTCYPGGPSRIQLLTGDASTPMMAVHDAKSGQALLLLTDQRTQVGSSGFDIQENMDKSTATLAISAPGVREKHLYQGRPSRDVGRALATGERIDLRVRVVAMACATNADFMERVFAHRHDLSGAIRARQDLPFATAWSLQERKYNRENWVEEEGYYSVGMRESPPQDWQTGWVGGPNAAYALLVEGDALSQQRVFRLWDFIATQAVTPSGFVKSTYYSVKKVWSGDTCYLRYSADTLYFLMKTLLLLQKRPPHCDIPASWLALARGLANGFAQQFEREGRFVHHVNKDTGATVIGGSCAAGLAPAAMALAARYFTEPRYLAAAEGAAAVYDREFVAKGITNAGPGDIFQSIDSESCAALVDSFAVLFEETGKAQWLAAGRACAHLAATWTHSYDFVFPATSTFGKLDMLTNGTVWANVQNKHSAPGICTLSGDGLLKLYRACGDVRILELIRDIAHAIPQYLSRADRPIVDIRVGKRWPIMPPGWMNERVNTSDWEVRDEPWEEIGVGEIFGGSCWSEASMLLTYAELPGVYIDTDTLHTTIFDHVHVQIEQATPNSAVVAITNPTPFAAVVKILAESAVQRAVPLGATALTDALRLSVAAGTTAKVKIPR